MSGPSNRAQADDRGDVAAQLRSIGLLRDLPDIVIRRLAAMVERVLVEPGDCAVRVGDASDGLMLIVSGQAKVVEQTPSGDRQVVGHLSDGEYFGEIGLLTAQRRTADVVATSPLRLLRLSRSSYVELLGDRPDVHAEVAETAARRSGATLGRLADAPAQPAQSLSFDQLLHRLIDHEIDSMRAAEIRGDPISFDEIVEFYGTTRFLYPGKLGMLEPRFDAVGATWQKLVRATNDIFKILMLRRVVDGRMVIKNSICAFEYASGAWQIQHLVSADRHQRSGTLAALVGIIDWFDSRPDVSSVRWSYRPDNPGTNALFGGLADALPTSECLQLSARYYVTGLGDRAPNARRDSQRVKVRRAAGDDIEMIRGIYSRRHPRLPSWLDLGDPDLSHLGARYARYQLERRRELYVATLDGRLCGTVACWWASEGINLSFLENTIDDLYIDQSLPGEDRRVVARELVEVAIGRYRDGGRSYVVAQLDDSAGIDDPPTPSLPPSAKTYASLMTERSVFPAARAYFERHYRALLLAEAPDVGGRAR